MWLRDSSAQLFPLLEFDSEEPGQLERVGKAIVRQWTCLAIDIRANAFNQQPSGRMWQVSDQTDLAEVSKWVWERKFELDSVTYPLQLLVRWASRSADPRSSLRALFGADYDELFLAGIGRVLELMRVEQDHPNKSSYFFRRVAECPEIDTIAHNGHGRPVQPRVGLIWSGFRPSDDACHFHYNIPQNMYAAATLEALAPLLERLERPDLAGEARAIAGEVREGIAKHGVVQGPLGRPIWAYEVDALGSYLIQDDANVPSLLSAPYLGFCPRDHQLYLDTRTVILSTHNPFYYSGAQHRGIGSPHAPKDHIWPLAIAMEGLTAATKEEAKEALQRLVASTAGTNRMHESFHKDNPAIFTREDFLWADALFYHLAVLYK
jgi:meiotically up-regulated gene 157 (Mug157) protein